MKVKTLTLSTLLLFCCVLVSARQEPLLEWGFQLICSPNGIPLTSQFIHATGVSNQNEWECERYTTENGRETSACVPSQLVVKPIVLQRVLTTSDELWNWRDLVANGQLSDARANCALQMTNRNYSVAMQYIMYNAWPASVELKTLLTNEDSARANALQPGKAALYEEVVLIHEGLVKTGHLVPYNLTLLSAKRDVSGIPTALQVQQVLEDAGFGAVTVISVDAVAGGFVARVLIGDTYAKGLVLKDDGTADSLNAQAELVASVLATSFGADSFGSYSSICVVNEETSANAGDCGDISPPIGCEDDMGCESTEYCEFCGGITRSLCKRGISLGDCVAKKVVCVCLLR